MRFFGLGFFGLDVHLDFCEVAVSEAGKVSRVGRIASTPEAIREFAADLKGSDQVVLEASCGAMMIARLLAEGRVGGVVVCNAAETRAISHARVKSDRFDAAMLAKLLSAKSPRDSHPCTQIFRSGRLPAPAHIHQHLYRETG